jgi:TldD protein
MHDLSLSAPAGGSYSEVRQHELRKTRMVMIDGSLTVNSDSTEAGTSARVFDRGYWGFASAPGFDAGRTAEVGNKALANAGTIGAFGGKSALTLPSESYTGEHEVAARANLSQRDRVELLQAMHALCKRKYPDLSSTTFVLHTEEHRKHLATSIGSNAVNTIRRAACYAVFTAEDENGSPVELMEIVSGKGSLTDLGLTLDDLEARFDRLYEHLRAKRIAVPARGGRHTVVLAPEITGILAHEAMGHPCEADLVLGGAVTGDLRGQQVASELITMVDFAHSYEGAELMIPVYADDEGTPARDAVLIDRGRLTDFMQSRETAARTDLGPTGNARAYQYGDEPLVRMRNTAILPGTDRLEDMIAGVEDGYFLMRTGNGQADSTTEFMFGVNLGYEIKNGKLGRAIRDTTLSGNAIKMLQSVDAVSDEMHWECWGYCGKKQPMVVSTGGPALRGVAHLGGE